MKSDSMTTENVPAARPEMIPQRSCEFDEGKIETRDGLRLRLRTAILSGPVRAELLVTHGLGEHAGRYTHVAAALAERGIRVTAYDLRGHGRSPGARVDVERYELLLDDLRAVLDRVRAAGRPVFLLGHSLGAQVTLRLLQREQLPVVGAIVLAPWIWLAFEPPWWKLILARLALRYFPQLRFPTGMKIEGLTRDRAHVEAMMDADLVTHSISARMYFAVCEQGERVLRESNRLATPVFLAHGDSDPVTHWRATEELYVRPGPAEKIFKAYSDAVHELHNDTIREEVLRDIGDWIVARC